MEVIQESQFVQHKRPLIGKREILLEWNTFITVHGMLQLDEDGLHFEPGLDARMIGISAFNLPLPNIKAAHRVDGGRRVVIEGEQEHVFRGPTAMMTWLILSALKDHSSYEPEWGEEKDEILFSLGLRTDGLEGMRD